MKIGCIARCTCHEGQTRYCIRCDYSRDECFNHQIDCSCTGIKDEPEEQEGLDEL